MESHYNKVISRALEYAGLNLSSPLTVQNIAKNIGYSASRLMFIFKKTTGKGLISHVVAMRIEKAKHLLLQSSLSISEIAAEAGFHSHEQFCRMFRKKTGLSPSAYRGQSSTRSSPAQSLTDRSESSLHEWLNQEFFRPAIEEGWDITAGHLLQQPDYAIAEGHESFSMQLRRALPENFEAQVELRLQAGQDPRASHFIFSLTGAGHSAESYGLVLGDYENRICYLRFGGIIAGTMLRPPIRPDRWQTLKVRLCNDLLEAELDGNHLFRHRSGFPLRYDQRCGLRFGTYASSVCLRRLVILDLGFPAAGRPPGQGDALYNAGVFYAAREFYIRQLESKASFADPGELYYKIGMCCMAEESLAQSRVWLEKAALLPKSDFWAARSVPEITYLDLIESKPNAEKNAARLLSERALNDEMRIVIERAERRLFERGFFGRSLEINRLLRDCEESNSPLFWLAQGRAGEYLFWMHKENEAEEILRRMAEAPDVSRQTRFQALFDLGYAYLMQGKLRQSRLSLAEARKIAGEAALIANCLLRDVFVLRAEGKMDDALKALEKVDTYCGRQNLSSHRVWVKLDTALLWCSLENTEKAMAVLTEIDGIIPGFFTEAHGGRNLYHYPPLFLQGRYEDAAGIVLETARSKNSGTFDMAEKAALAAMIFEVSGDKRKARDTWNEIIRRFPLERCSFYSNLATAMLQENWTVLRDLPSGAINRSELFYLAGIMFETRGDSQHSREFLELCIKEDPSLRWPSYLAKQKLSGKA